MHQSTAGQRYIITLLSSGVNLCAADSLPAPKHR